MDSQCPESMLAAGPAMLTPARTAQSSIPRPRRWYQFSLRTLLLVMVVVSLVVGLVGIRMQRARRQEAATDAIHAIGGEAWVDVDQPTWRSSSLDFFRPWLGDDFFDSVVAVEVDLSRADTTARQLAIWNAIGDLPQLETLQVDYPRRYPRSRFNIGPIRRLTKLHRLKIRDARIDGDDLAPLTRMPSLAELDLSHNEIGDAAWRHLAAVPKLQRLDASYSFVSDQGAGYLAGCQSLRELVLTRTNVSDRGAAELANMTHLKVLVLDGTRITDAGLASLAKMESLRSLTIRETRITDQGLVALAKAAELSVLDVSRTNITRQGARRLEEMRPGMKVTY